MEDFWDFMAVIDRDVDKVPKSMKFVVIEIYNPKPWFVDIKLQ